MEHFFRYEHAAHTRRVIVHIGRQQNENQLAYESD